ncbi:MAG TPA: DUF4129 domain-containing protein [Xanthobacteraceae bacterium]|nr:DUF4129 domain-containing protein [Xanthobacteraceae bacterium]
MRCRLCVIVAAVTILSSGAPAARVESAVKDSIRALDLQTQLPEERAEAADKAAKDSIHSLDLQTELPRRTEPARVPLSIPSWVLWLGLGCAAALLIYALRDELAKLLGRRESGWEPPPPGTGEVAIGRDHDALAAADRLSREGNFVEAMHVLLLHSVEEIRRQLGEKFADSLTSREILRVARLTAAARASLRDIVAAVERTYFGAYPATAGDYATCRQNFETLQQALHGGAPA